MGRALLVVVLMIAITAIVCVVIYGVMIAIRPIEPRDYRKASEIGLLAPRASVTLWPAPADAPSAARARAQLLQRPVYKA